MMQMQLKINQRIPEIFQNVEVGKGSNNREGMGAQSLCSVEHQAKFYYKSNCVTHFCIEETSRQGVFGVLFWWNFWRRISLAKFHLLEREPQTISFVQFVTVIRGLYVLFLSFLFLCNNQLKLPRNLLCIYSIKVNSILITKVNERLNSLSRILWFISWRGRT